MPAQRAQGGMGLEQAIIDIRNMYKIYKMCIRDSAQIQVRHAPAHRHLGAAYLYALGVGELSGMDSRGL